jgi:hypothetical protein
MSRAGFAFRLIGAALLVALVIGGGYMAYRAGVAQGISQAPAVATAISKAAENGQPAPFPGAFDRRFGYDDRVPFGYGPMHRFGFFPFGGICFSIVALFFFLGLMRMVFFRPWRMGWSHHGHTHYHEHPCMKEDEKKEETKEEKQ